MIIAMIADIEEDSSRKFMLDLYLSRYSLVRHTIYKVTHDKNHLEDLISDTFVRLISKVSLLSKFDSCRLTTYVVYTARSVAINFIRRRDVERKHSFYGDESDTANEVAACDSISILNNVIRAEDADQLKSAILKLPQNQRDILYFKYFLEMDDREIADILGISSNSVRTYLMRARRAAKDLILEEV